MHTHMHTHKRTHTKIHNLVLAQGKALALSWNVPFFEASAMERVNVDEAFFQLLREVRQSQLLTANTTPKETACNLS